MTDIEAKTTCRTPGRRVGSWCVSAINQHKKHSKKNTTLKITNNTTTTTNSTTDHNSKTHGENTKEQYIPIDINKSAIKIGNRKFYFLKKTKENHLVACQTWKVQKHGPETEDRCTICLENYAAKDTAMSIACSHTFHKDCMLKWLQRQKRCPLCQTTVELTVYGEKKAKKEDDPLMLSAMYSPSGASLLYASGYSSYMF